MESAQPKAVKWAKALCGLLVLAQVGIFGLGLWLIRNADWIVGQALGESPPTPFFVGSGMLLIVMAIAFGFLNAVTAFLKPTPIAYVAHLSNMIAGAVTIVLLPVVVPLFIQWLKPEVRSYFKVS